MKRIIALGKEARQQLKSGVNLAAEAIKPTLGPKGCSALIYTKSVGLPLVIDDGASIARLLQDENSVVNAGMALINEVASQADAEGDGTTSATILADSIITDAIGAIDSGASQKQIKQGIEKATELASKTITAISKKVTSVEDLVRVAMVSSNDKELADLVGTTVYNVGKDGIVHVENGNGTETTVDMVSGLKYERGYLSRFFVNRPDKNTFELNNCKILLLDHSFSSGEDAKHVLQMMAMKGFGLLVIADGVEDNVLGWFYANARQAGLKICAIKAPGHGDLKRAYFQDIAAVTGATILGSASGIELDKLNPEANPGSIEEYLPLLGEANVIVGQNTCALIKENLSNETYTYIDNLQKQLEGDITEYERQQLSERIANLTGAVAIIHVGGLTDTEVEAKKAKIEDAKNSAKAALLGGYVCGAGSAYLYAHTVITRALKEKTPAFEGLSEDALTGVKIVANALTKITKQLGDNSNDVGDVIVRDVLNALLNSDGLPENGYDALNNKIVNLYKEGIIDATNVVRNSLEKAASLAATVIMTATVVTEQAEESDKINWSIAMRGR